MSIIQDLIKRSIFLLFVFCIAALTANAQNVTRVEYFVDTDPGFGNANNVTITPGLDVTANFQFDISALPFGFHNLYIRSYVNPYQVVEDGITVTKGGWSLANVRNFYKEDIINTGLALPNIVAGEYFVDTDPGFGSGSNIPLTAGADISSLSFAFDITALTTGFHNLYVRFKDVNGKWSLANVRNFYKETIAPAAVLPNITNGEYFIDADPGFGSGVSIPVVPGTDINNLAFTFDITSLPAGFHNLYVRFKNANGHWSHPAIRNFYKEDLGGANNVLPNITSGEYFIDTDPGHGNGTSISVAAASNISNQNFTADITSLPAGFHNIGIRFKDANGRWGHTNHRNFYKESFSAAVPLSNIVKLEYFINTDPGFGNGTPVSVNPSTDISSFTFPVDMTNVSIGNHKIYVRALDASGKWSLVSNGSFIVEPPAAIYITIGNLSATACAGSGFDIPFAVNMPYGSNNIFTAQLSDANGNFTNPVNIGTFTGTDSDTIHATIPANAAIGNSYRVRILASSPLDTSAPGSTSFFIRRVPEQYFVINGKSQTCIGAEVYSASAVDPNVTYTWTLSGGGTMDTTGTTATVSWTTAGVHTLTLTPSNNCGNGQPRTLQVTVYSTAPVLTPLITVNGRNLYASNPNSSTVNGYKWYRNDTVLAGITGSYYYAAIDGAYKVAYTNNCGEGPKSNAVSVITLLTQTVVFDTIPNKTFGDNPFKLHATASSGLTITFSVISGPATINGDTLTLTAAGTVTVRASQGGNATYASAYTDRTFVVAAPPLPDLTIENITATPTEIAPGDSVTVNWSVKNIGQGPSVTNWTEKIYVQSSGGANRTLVQQVSFSNSSLLQANSSVPRSLKVGIPVQLNIGEDGVFVVEFVPASNLQEVAGGNANNTGVQVTAWNVKKQLSLQLSASQLTEGGSAITATITRTGSFAAALPVSVNFLHPQRFVSPAIVTIPAGQAGVNFTISAFDNLILEPTLHDTVSVSAGSYSSASAKITLFDNDIPALSIVGLQSQVTEGDTVSFQVVTNLMPSAPLQVFLTSSSQAILPLPSSVTIPAGQLSVLVKVPLVQDSIPELSLSVTMQAGASGHTATSTLILINDDDLLNLELVVQRPTISEGDGPFATQATLRRTAGSTNTAFTVNLSAGLPNTLLIPASISLAANETSKTFTVGVIDNAIVDTTRLVKITASLYVTACNCSAPPNSAGSVSANISVTDNDGATLVLTASQLTLAEGLTNAAVLRITRNTSTASSLLVNLSSSDTTEATIPATATIPVGQTYVDVPITTINDGMTDGSQMVYFYANASGFSQGSVWVMVTDQNKPDFIIPSLALGDTAIQAMAMLTYGVAVLNNGYATAPAGAVVKGYLSTDNNLDNNDVLVSTDTINVSIPVGQTIQVLNAMRVPDLPGKYKLIYRINEEATVNELVFTNNTSPSKPLTIIADYTATANVGGNYFLRGVPVPVTGVATRYNGTVAANKQVDVYVITNGLRRVVSATTDNAGNYAAQFTPLSGEAGHYTVGACFPNLGDTASQDAFDIVGVKINDGSIPQYRVTLNDTLHGSVQVKNLSNKPLSNFSLVPVTIPGGAQIKFDTIATIPGNATVALTYRISGNSVSQGSNFEVANLQAKSNEGVIQPFDFFYYCQAPNGYLEASINTISATVSQSGGEKLVEFMLTNIGVGSTGAITINLPQVSWLTSITPKVLNALSAGDTAVVVLKFTATSDVPFNYPINGTIGVAAQNGNAFTIPFKFEKVSQSNGTAKVTVTDQFTYYTDGEPKVKDARVIIKNYFTGVVYAQGFTDTSGVFIGANIPEGKHRIVIEKDKHEPYNGTITIEPGDTAKANIFISYQAITFSWNVVPTAIQDQYNITLTTVFETHVPMPVVTINMPATMPQLTGTQVYPFNVILTNHGLITAKDVALNLPTNDPEYEFVTNYVPADLLAQQSIQVPVIMRRRGAGSGGRGGPSVESISQFLGMSLAQYNAYRTQSLNCQDFTSVVYWYKCNLSDGKWEQGGVLFTYEGRSCTGSGGGGTGGGGILIGGGGIGGGSGFPPCAICPVIPGGGGTGPTPAYDNDKKNCVDCLKALYEALKACLIDPPPPIDCGIDTYLNQGGASDYAKCLIESQMPGIDDLVDEIADKIPYLNKLLCIKAVMEAIADCLESMNGRMAQPRILNLYNLRTASTSSGIMQTFHNNYLNVYNAFQLRVNWISEYYGDLSNFDGWKHLYVKIKPYADSLDTIPVSVQTTILSAMTGFDIPQTEIQSFFQRWNLSIQARDANVLTPNAQYPNIINWTNVKRWSDSLVLAHNYSISNGFSDINSMYVETRSSLDTFIQNQMNAVCAKVTVQFSQHLTMTREAFDGTLEIFNGHPTDKMDSLSVEIKITDANGVPSNGLFQINTTSLTNLPDVTGTGYINAQQKGSVKFLFIPEVGAAPQTPKVYNFGGLVRYWDPYVQRMVTMPLSDVALTVNPSPNLMLHYFMQRNILGDDALTTPEIEPSVPAELAVMVENQGYGPAVNMMISSAQPKIVENEKGLAINFTLIGSNYQGQPTNFGVTDINFGTVPPLQTRIGQWFFTSSLLGKFVSYQADVVHANSFGNPELSLIKGVNIHELAKSIKVYGGANDGLNDFLVNDIFDVNDQPDIIYYSQGVKTAKVHQATSGSFSSSVAPPSFTNILTVNPSDTGWNYIRLADPGNKMYELESVTRSDGQVIPLNNAWLTFVTLPVNQPPLYENKFHFVDTFPSLNAATYTVVWKPKNLDVPKIDTIKGVAPASITSEQVQHLQVVFTKPINASTFTYEDLSLTFQGGANIMNNSVVITQVDSVTFDVDLSSLTTGNGFYNFTAQAANVKDIYDINGLTGKQLTWTQFLNVPTVQAFLGIPDTHFASSYDTINVLFNLPLNLSTVTPSSFIITKDGITQSGSVVIDSIRADKKMVYISGLGSILTQSGEYEFIVDLPNIQSELNVAGMQQQSIKLTVDNVGPQLVNMMAFDSTGLDLQHIPYVKLDFNENVYGFNTSSLQLTRNGSVINLNIAQLANLGLKNWIVGNLGMATYPDGNYILTINLNGVRDAAGNYGTGTQQVSWIVNRSIILLVNNVSITPDLGFSSTDGITSEQSVRVGFTIGSNASKVTLSQVDLSGEKLLGSFNNISAGDTSFAVNLAGAGNGRIKITAIGTAGGSGIAEKNLFIDAVPLTANWLFAAAQNLPVQTDTISILLSSRLLNDTVDFKNALRLQRNGQPLAITNLYIHKANDTVYRVYNLRQVAAQPGTYTMSLQLDSLRKYSSGKKGNNAITVSWLFEPVNRAPIAKAGKDTTIVSPGFIVLNATGSSDPDGDALTYQWIAPPGVVLNDSSSPTPGFLVNNANFNGTYAFLLIVDDGKTFSTAVVKVNVNLSLCPGSNTYYTMPRSGFGGGTYQWQLDTGSGFTDLLPNDGVHLGVNSDTLRVLSLPTGYRGYKYRCVNDDGISTRYSQVYVVVFQSIWLGNVSDAWENPSNWSCGTMPDEYTEVTIPGGRTHQPVVSQNTKVYGLQGQEGAIVTIKAGVNLEVKGKE